MESLEQIIQDLDLINKQNEQIKLNIEKSLNQSYLLRIPKTFLLMNICQYLDSDDINRLACTSTILYNLIFSPIGLKILLKSHQISYKIIVNQQFNIKSNQVIEQLMENNQKINSGQTEEDILAYIETLKKKQEFFQIRFKEDQNRIESLQKQIDNVQDKLTSERQTNAQNFIRLQKMEQQFEKMLLENKDHRDNFKEINTKYQTIIQKYMKDMDDLKEQNFQIENQKKVLAVEVKRQRVEIDKLSKQNDNYKQSLGSLKQVFDRSQILDKIKNIVQKQS